MRVSCLAMAIDVSEKEAPTTAMTGWEQVVVLLPVWQLASWIRSSVALRAVLTSEQESRIW